MLLIEKMKQAKDLSTAQQHVIDYMLTHPEMLSRMSLQEVSKAAYTSPATLVRLAKKFGYEGFIEFRDDYLKEEAYLESQVHQVDANVPFVASDSIMSISHKISTLEKETIDDTLSLLDHDTLRQAVNILRDCETIHLCGVSFNHFLGDMFAGKMMRIGKPVMISSSEEDYMYTSAIIKPNDAAIIVSYSGSLPVIRKMLKLYRNHRIPVIALTSYGPSELRNGADVTLTITTREKMYSKIAGYSNEVSIKLLLDILYSCYFSLDYENNMTAKRALSHQIESYKTSSNEIINEQ